MSDITVRKILRTLAAGIIAAAAAGFVCLLTAPEKENASALVFIRSEESEDSPVNTTVTRSISAMRRFVTSRETIAAAAAESGVDRDKLASSVSVERLGESDAAQITLSGLDNPENAPIILGILINLSERSDVVPDFNVISYCDISAKPYLPYPALCVSSGLAASAVYIAAAGSSRSRKRRRMTAAERETAEYHRVVSVKEMLKRAAEEADSIGTLPVSAPGGLEKSGYMKAAARLFALCRGVSPAVIAVCSGSQGSAADKEHVSNEARAASYLACACAAMGKRTALIECCLKAPCIGKIFGKTGAGGLSDIAAGNCTVWDSIVVNAREGVDIIADNKTYPAPMAVFGSTSFSQLILFLSSQYDMIILSAPRAWGCSEWTLIERQCTGAVIALEKGKEIAADTAKGILGNSRLFTAVAEIIPDASGK